MAWNLCGVAMGRRLVILAGLVLSEACAEVPVPVDEPSSAVNYADDPLAGLSRAYGIEVVTAGLHFPVTTRHGMITGAAAEERAIAWYTPLFVQEFSLYPPSLVRRSGLSRVVFCENLSFNGQPRNAIPDFEHNDLYLETTRGSFAPDYMQTVIHHEFFHLIDYRDDGVVYGDDSWAAINASSMRYGTGGRNAQHRREGSMLASSCPGFLDSYATTGVEEDKAELFANMIVNSTAVSDLARSDPVLAAKVDRMKQLMHEFCPDMNDGFWAKAARLDRRYWGTMRSSGASAP